MTYMKKKPRGKGKIWRRNGKTWPVNGDVMTEGRYSNFIKRFGK